MDTQHVVAGAACAILSTLCLPSAAQAPAILEGDTRLACEAIMCLATSQRPHECNLAILRYLSIVGKKPGETVQARAAFLNKCPAGSQTPAMQSFVASIANGAGRCDAASINQANRETSPVEVGDGVRISISNVLPSYCDAYMNHAYTGGTIALPRYVGRQDRGGYWVEAAQYEQALSEYNHRIRQEDANALLSSGTQSLPTSRWQR
ncbi:conjugal transfer protein TrbM (plasmid) [Variovorax sp. SRS16]|uniref:TrbM/KikA/MpfK family conjugal transfer protein n=1 Tax=Variovorax sp. SRS16 TaxID=282217 RepID=UPI0013193FD0|nr:TrbM/KikA/MpfK family conjugal transfer protein [Variovorax sp. SRS16]VTU46195.1 conjugal transfer protein TrbM [Variovorax sp. SRS16]